MGFFGDIYDSIMDTDGSRAAADADAATMKKAETAIKESKHLQTFGLTCKGCKKLAVPIPMTDRNYRCSCGQQFSGPKHPFKFGLYDASDRLRTFETMYDNK